ncbi:hypothetical protein [Mesorhizobium sp. M2E.F.Ca.ET.154.01.1.1]|uniref:hypothetical protein n=1 Tax=Mesorhizobium sp. M2E.F.Ca.ET.154.01.1.1 TaxID=2500521 RepID=UPI001AED8466|nr:hypothetical protein [Mesorhizobium sp. M2E.F.Ca.ET.154.01.1.1]
MRNHGRARLFNNRVAGLTDGLDAFDIGVDGFRGRVHAASFSCCNGDLALAKKGMDEANKISMAAIWSFRSGRQSSRSLLSKSFVAAFRPSRM